MKALEKLIDEVSSQEFYRAYKKRDEKIEEIRTVAKDLRKSQLIIVGKKVIRSLYFRVRQMRMAYTTFYSLLEIFRIYETPELYYYFQDIVLKAVRENKYDSQWFLITLLKVKNRLDGDTNRLQDIYIERYLSPNQNDRIDARFLQVFFSEIPFYDKSKLFRHCVRHKAIKDTYGGELLGIFFGMNPEYKKYMVLE